MTFKIAVLRPQHNDFSTSFSALIAVAATIESVYRELKLLRTEIKDLKSLLVLEVEPENDELKAIVEGEKEFKSSKYTDWRALKAKKVLNV